MNAALRRRALLMLWLLLALLPVRGWAGLAMHLPQSGSAAAMAPCHGVQAAPEADHDTASATACTLCELCHGAMLLPGMAPTAPDRPLQGWPAAEPPGAADPAPGQLFRPPRR